MENYKKYTLYAGCSDDEGGYGICLASEFTPNCGYCPESGWRAKPSVKIGDFNTVSELADLLYVDDPNWFVDEPGAFMEAVSMMASYDGKEEGK